MSEVNRLTGVYQADGSVLGELTYVVGHLLGRRHCALCDITHGTFRPRAAFRDRAGAVPVPFDLVHLDERSDAVRVASEGRTPCVLAHTDRGIEVLVEADGLAGCTGDPALLFDLIETTMATRGLSWGC